MNTTQEAAMLLRRHGYDVTAAKLELESMPRRVRLKLDYNLTTDQVSKSMDCAKGRDWTAFVNKKRTLVHVMRDEHPALLIRLPRMKMKDMSRKGMIHLITGLLYEGLS